MAEIVGSECTFCKHTAHIMRQKDKFGALLRGMRQTDRAAALPMHSFGAAAVFGVHF